jgi:hypothetical protein
MDDSNLAESSLTIPSDSETYSDPSPASSSSSPLILYKTPSLFGLLRGAAINLLLPFVNGLMLGFGELVANEAAFRLGWSGTKVCLEICFGRVKWDTANLGLRYRFSQRIEGTRGGWDRAWK